MDRRKISIVVSFVAALILAAYVTASAGEVWVKCHITCRCSHDDSVGNFLFVIPVETERDVTFEADWACKVYGNRVCADGCNGTKFTFTYQVISP
jgi:hypothetical protein